MTWEADLLEGEGGCQLRYIAFSLSGNSKQSYNPGLILCRMDGDEGLFTILCLPPSEMVVCTNIFI